MSDNTHFYGFRWAYNANGKDMPKPELMDVATGANFTVSGDATNLNLNVGDPVALLSSGCIGLCGNCRLSEFRKACRPPVSRLRRMPGWSIDGQDNRG